MDGQRYTGLLDMINGGGPGQAGATFEGGLLSGLLNALGIRPHGYRDRLSEMRPMPRPAGLGVAPRPAPATTDYISQHFERNAAPPPTRDYIGQHFERNAAPRDYIGQHMARNAAPPPMRDYIGQHFERNAAPAPSMTPPAPPAPSAPPAAPGSVFGQDPGRVNEFARWMVDNYGVGPDALPNDTAQRMYTRWLNARTGYRL